MRVINGIVYRLRISWGWINRFFYEKPQIMNTVDSLNYIINTKCSIARFGDGEFNLMRGQSLGFQSTDSSLAFRLKEVLHSRLSDLKIGLPQTFHDMQEYQKEPRRFWLSYMGMHRGEIIKEIELSQTYINTNMTRFWTGYKDHCNTVEILTLYKQIWEERDVIIVEGEKTRMGVGNDLFNNTRSIKRILCPSINAWDRYGEIIDTIRASKANQDTLFIIALGPTATIMAYDLTKMGYQALDLGHLDIQYEYYLKKAVGRIAVQGKYVNENVAGHEVSDSILDKYYEDSIIGRIVG